MKFAYSLTLSFLLFVFITNLSIAFSNDCDEEVLDITGEPVIAGKEYYIATSIEGGGIGSGLKLGKTSSNSKCEVTILQNNNTIEVGISVKFTNLKGSSQNILTGTPFEIEVIEKPDCAGSSKWIVFVDNNVDKACVGIGGRGNYYKSKILTGTFGILKHGFGYQFGFCAGYVCSNIGTYEHIGEGGKRLFLSRDVLEDPYEFVFVGAFFDSGIIKSVA